MGGIPDETLLDHVLSLAPGKRLLYVPTATMEIDQILREAWQQGLHFTGTELGEVVTSRSGASGYRVTRDGETELDARLLQ